MQNTLITIALRGITVLPRMRIYLDMNRPMSIAAATNAQKTNQNVFLVAQKDPSVENPGQEQLEQFGVIAQVKQIIKGPEDSFRVLVTGLQSAKLESIEEYVPNLIARVTVFESEKSDEQEILADDLDKEDQEKKIEEEAKSQQGTGQFAAAAHGYRRFLCTYRMQFAYEAAGTSEIFGRISG